MKSYLSIALLSKNPCEEKSLCKKLDEIDKMKNKILRESAAKMSNFALQHLYIAKYYDAKNGQQCRPLPKVAQNSVCSLPRLSEKRQQSKSTSSPGCFEPRADCVKSKPRYRRSLSDKCLPVSPNLSDEQGPDPGDSKAQSIASQPNSPRQTTSTQNSKPKYRRSLSEVLAPTAGFMSGGEDEESENAPKRFLAWGEKENKENSYKNCGGTILKPKLSRSTSQYLAPKLDNLAQDDHEAVFDEGKEAEIPVGALKRRRQRRVTVAGETPTITREFCRWQQTVKLVKDLPKSEQAEIIRGACFLRMAVPGFSSPVKTDTPKPARQRKISTVTPPCGQQLVRATHNHPKFTALTE